MTRIEILGVPQETSLEELATFVKSLPIPDLEIVMSVGRFEVWTSTDDTTAVSQIETAIVEKAVSLLTLRSKITYKVSDTKGHESL